MGQVQATPLSSVNPPRIGDRIAPNLRYPAFREFQFAHWVVDGDTFRCQTRVQLFNQLAANHETGQSVLHPHNHIEVDVAVAELFVAKDGIGLLLRLGVFLA